MISLKKNNILTMLLFLISFSILIIQALPNGLGTLFLGNTLFANSSQILPSLGGADPAWYLTAALDLKDFQIETQNYWIFNLWPPGMAVYLFILDFVTFGSGIIFINLIILTFLWSLSYTIFARYLINSKSRMGFILFTLIWIFSPLPKFWNSGLGLLSADAISLNIAVILTLMLILSKPVDYMKRKEFIIFIFCVALLLSLLSHFKIIWLLSISLMFSLGILFIVLKFFFMKVKFGNNSKIIFVGTNSKTFLFILLIYVVSILPWTYIVEKKFHPGSYSWSKSNYQYSQRWMPTEYLNEIGASFLVSGGANWACLINDELCEKIYKSEIDSGNPYSGLNISYDQFQRLAFSQIIENPVGFIDFKSKKTLETWMSKPGASVGDNSGIVFGVTTLIGLIGSFIMALMGITRNYSFIYITILTYSIFFLGIMLNHFETRYILPLHTFSILLFFFLLSNYRYKSSRLERLEFKD